MKTLLTLVLMAMVALALPSVWAQADQSQHRAVIETPAQRRHVADPTAKVYPSPVSTAGVFPLSIGLIPPAQFPAEDWDVMGLRLNIFVGQHNNVGFIDLGVLGNLSHGDVMGLEIAGVWNQVAQNAQVIQIAGIGNHVLGQFKGLQFAGVVDEENGASSKLGVRYLLDQGLIRARGAIYTYTSDIVCVGHRGLLRFALSAHGQTVHSGSPEWAQGKAGINAVTSLASILIKLEALRMPYPQHPAFSHLKCTITPGTTFSGGEWTGMVPALAKRRWIRLMPGQDGAKVIDEMDEIISQERKHDPVCVWIERFPSTCPAQPYRLITPWCSARRNTRKRLPVMNGALKAPDQRMKGIC